MSDRLTGLMNRLGSILIGMLLVGTILLPRASFADDVSRRKSVSVKIIAINDFHGNLKPPFGGIRIRCAAGDQLRFGSL